MKKKKVILFDLDLTLVHTGGAGALALEEAFAHIYGIPDSLKTLTLDGKTDPAIVREMIRFFLKRDAENGEIERVCRAYLDNLKRLIPSIEKYRVLPGVHELLENLAKHPDVLLGLGTGNLREGAQIKLSRAGLFKYFSFGGFSDDGEERVRVLAAGVTRSEKLLGFAPEPRDVVIIGDHFRDIVAGQAIGATVIAVATGHLTTEQLAEYKPDVVVPDLTHQSHFIDLLIDASAN